MATQQASGRYRHPSTRACPPGCYSRGVRGDEQQPRHERFYRRYGNPTQARLETLVAALEGAEADPGDRLGMGATCTAFLALLARGDHVVAQTSMYGGTLSLLQSLGPRFGVEATFVDQAEVDAFERPLRPETRLIMLESPSNPLLQLTDIAEGPAM